LRKDLGYAYLKIGETEAARDEFAEALRLDPVDSQAALEYAFLCHETGRSSEARRIFDRLRKAGNATAETAFQNIDRPLAEGITRWGAVVAQSPNNYSARRELARLAEQRGELASAAEHYLAAWKLRPAGRDVLVELGRVCQALDRPSEANAALLAASRGSSPRAADQAREMLPPRYPYVGEFESALELDPDNVELRRELAYLLLAMGRQIDGEVEFERVLKVDPRDRLAAAQLGLMKLARGERGAAMALFEIVFATEDALAVRVRESLGATRRAESPPQVQNQPQNDPKEIGERSYKAGMLRDALKYFTAAHDRDPVDFAVMLKLGWTYNLLQDDRNALRWFELARRSPDPAVAGEAARASRNLRPAQARFRTTLWALPFFSSRWHDAFAYAQIKTEMRAGSLPVRPYLSLRFIGDARNMAGETVPQYLSETAFIAGAGLSAQPWRGLTLWGEAGEAISYRKRPGRMAPDYRGGAAYTRAFGAGLEGESPGWFAETGGDLVFVSRFGRDVLAYWQNRLGYSLPAAGALRGQLYATGNLTADIKREPWANVAEFGPGFKFKIPPCPAVFTVGLMRGAYTREGSPHGPNFFDLRAGFWYALSR
jgi:tetratricopeptide (TPR) repeat protein